MRAAPEGEDAEAEAEADEAEGRGEAGASSNDGSYAFVRNPNYTQANDVKSKAEPQTQANRELTCKSLDRMSSKPERWSLRTVLCSRVRKRYRSLEVRCKIAADVRDGKVEAEADA